VIASARVCGVTDTVAMTVATIANKPIVVFRSTMNGLDIELGLS
jgi:hypothetical protein